MKKLIYTYLFSVLALPGYSQMGGIKGYITTGNSSVEMVNIQLEGTSEFKGTTTDEDGFYEITNVPPGAYILKVSRLGYKTISENLEIKPGRVLVKDFTLQEDRLSLEQIVVSATRYNLDRREAPVLVKVMDAEIFNATQSFSLAEGLNFQPGVRVETNCQNCGFTQVRLNGLNGPYSQILVNSRPVFSALRLKCHCRYHQHHHPRTSGKYLADQQQFCFY